MSVFVNKHPGSTTGVEHCVSVQPPCRGPLPAPTALRQVTPDHLPHAGVAGWGKVANGETRSPGAAGGWRTPLGCAPTSRLPANRKSPALRDPKLLCRSP